MWIILGILALGALLGFVFRRRNWFHHIDQTISYTIYAMLFLFGITIGQNREVISNIGEFGLQALFLAVMGILGSVLVGWMLVRILQRKEVEK